MLETTRFLVAPLLLMSALGSAARAQTPPPEQAPAPAAAPAAPAPAAAPPPGSPPPGYPPPGYPPPGYAPPPGYPPPGYGYPPPGYAAPGYAPPPRHLAGFHEHDGFYLRLHTGAGYTRMSANSTGNDIVISGGSLALSIAVGGAITDNLILFGTFTFAEITSPDIKINGMSFGTSNNSADSAGLGGGVAYYFEPSNVYLSGSLLAHQLQISDSGGNAVAQTQWGVGFEGLVGKEWWVSDNWGLGIAAQFLFASMKDKPDATGLVMTGDTPTWTTETFSLLFSATYN
jgi:hypothetical protein